RRCLVIRNAARRLSSHGSDMAQLKLARRPFCSTEGASLASEIDMEPRETIAFRGSSDTVKRVLFSGFLLLAAGSAPSAAQDRVYASHLMVDQDVAVASRISGVIASIAVDRGAVVTQGQELAALDPREADADVREAKEDMDLKKAEYNRAESL